MLVGGGILKNDKTSWKRAEISNISALKSFWWVGGGGWCTYDYSVSLNPNLWIMTFNLDLDIDLGLTILFIRIKTKYLLLLKNSLNKYLKFQVLRYL